MSRVRERIRNTLAQILDDNTGMDLVRHALENLYLKQFPDAANDLTDEDNFYQWIDFFAFKDVSLPSKFDGNSQIQWKIAHLMQENSLDELVVMEAARLLREILQVMLLGHETFIVSFIKDRIQRNVLTFEPFDQQDKTD